MGGQGKGNGLSLRHAVKNRIRGRGVDVGVPSDLPAAAVALLMLNGDQFKQLEYLSHLEINWTEPLSLKVLSLIPALGFMFQKSLPDEQ